MEQLNKIAIIGGTGKAGKILVKELVNQGFKIKVLLRNPEKLDINNPLVEKIQGDVRNYESVHALISGCSAVISTLGQTKAEELVFSVAAENIIKAMKSLHVSRYILLTGMTIVAPQDKKSLFSKFLAGIMKLNFRDIIADKQKEFGLISESGLEWTVVRVPMIEQTEITRPVKVSLEDCPGNKISTTDLVNFLIKQLPDKEYLRKAPFISN